MSTHRPTNSSSVKVNLPQGQIVSNCQLADREGKRVEYLLLFYAPPVAGFSNTAIRPSVCPLAQNSAFRVITPTRNHMLEVERRRTTGSGSRPLYRFAAIGEIPCYAIKCFTDSGGGARGLRPSSSLLIIKSRPTIMLCSHKAVATRNAKYAICSYQAAFL